MNNYIKLVLPSLSINESLARSCVAALFGQLNPSIEQINDLKTAVSEAVTNCIVHAYDNVVGEISIESTLMDNEIKVVIQDCGKGIENIEEAMKPFVTSKLDNERSGMGFTVMKTFTDKLEVQSKVNEGTTITMYKRV